MFHVFRNKEKEVQWSKKFINAANVTIPCSSEVFFYKLEEALSEVDFWGKAQGPQISKL